MGTTFDDPVVFRGSATFIGSTSFPAASISNSQVATGAGITADKMQHSHRASYAQVTGTNATANAGQQIHTVYGATATIKAIKAGSIVKATGDSTVTIDVKKNGTTVLSSTIVLDTANTNYIVEAGTLSVTSLVAGDVLTVVITVSAGSGTLPQGVWVYAEIWEDPQ